MAPPKPPNPSSKEILEEAIQMSTQHFNNAMAETQEQIDVRFAQISASIAQQMGEIHTRLNSEKEDEDAKYEALIAAIQKAGLNREKQPMTAAATPSASHSGTAQHSATVSFGSTPFTQTLTSAHTPLRNSPNHIHSNPQPSVFTTPTLTAAPPPPPFHTYSPYSHPQTTFIPPHTIPHPFPQPDFYQQQPHIPTLPPPPPPHVPLNSNCHYLMDLIP
ncbi:extensin-like [Vicia villosa]|uniref:extensin-like n=1 Tax=Vicia villosa TaxID=3911 RepID=UPI00273CDB4D|nr:extensin-like [Vicia villosa]